MPDEQQIEWPREIWMAECEDHGQGVVSAVLSVHATVARWEGDKEREREFHRYVDEDIFETTERYWKERAEKAEAALAEKEALLDRLWEADMRGIKMWQEANPGNDLVWPDRAQHVAWVLDQVAKLDEVAE
jgi:hypothetical protein